MVQTPHPAEPSIPEKPHPITGVGASAGGFETFRELLKALPSDTGLALLLVQHFDPGHESLPAKLLSKATTMPVAEVEEGMTVEPNHVYVIPRTRLASRWRNTCPSITFFTSLTADRGNRAIGEILSGTASDGTVGLKATKSEGGITFAQDIKSAKYDGMPRNAIVAGCVDSSCRLRASRASALTTVHYRRPPPRAPPPADCLCCICCVCP